MKRRIFIIIIGIIGFSVTNISVTFANGTTSKFKEIKGYCTTVKDSTKHCNSSIWQEASDCNEIKAENSLFLKILCSDIVSPDENKSTLVTYDENHTYIKRNNIEKIIKKNCKNNKESCNVAEMIDTVFAKLFSELFTIKEGVLFGLKQSNLGDTKNFDNNINAYVEKIGISDPTFEFCTDKNYNYAKTCNLLKKQMKSLNKAIKKFSIINSEKLYTDYKNRGTIKDCKKDKSVLCAIFELEENKENKEEGLKTQEGLENFSNYLYNELYWYADFSNEYGNRLDIHSTEENSKNSIRNFALNKQQERYLYRESLQDEIKELKINNSKFLDVTAETIKELINISTSYPIHVGFLAYQEDLLRLRKALSKIISPFYSIYHKFRNVQHDKQ